MQTRSMLDEFRSTDNRAISANWTRRSASCSFFERKGREDPGCNMRPTVIVCSCRTSSYCLQVPVIWQILFSRRRRRRRWTTPGLDDSSRTHISQSVRSCGNFDIPEYGARERATRNSSAGVSSLRFSMTRIIFSTMAIS